MKRSIIKNFAKQTSLNKIAFISLFLFFGISTSTYAAQHAETEQKTSKTTSTPNNSAAAKTSATSETSKIKKTESKNTKTTAASNELPRVIMETSSGKLVIELYPNKAPATVENFLTYVNDKFYDGTTFHRIVPGFVIQGGGYTFDLKQKPTRKPIVNEANNGLKNGIATLSMARTRAPNSATSQFFINTANNLSLDQSPSSAGYAVFGKVVEGFNVVKKIEKEPRGLHRHQPEAPNTPVIIEKAYVLENK